jgi:hypothetical protein
VFVFKTFAMRAAKHSFAARVYHIVCLLLAMYPLLTSTDSTVTTGVEEDYKFLQMVRPCSAAALDHRSSLPVRSSRGR